MSALQGTSDQEIHSTGRLDWNFLVIGYNNTILVCLCFRFRLSFTPGDQKESNLSRLLILSYLPGFSTCFFCPCSSNDAFSKVISPTPCDFIHHVNNNVIKASGEHPWWIQLKCHMQSHFYLLGRILHWISLWKIRTLWFFFYDWWGSFAVTWTAASFYDTWTNSCNHRVKYYIYTLAQFKESLDSIQCI